MSTVWKRARSDAQKAQRRATLLDAARRMLQSRSIDEISLNAIAREANISKANVYRYFESREDLFLQLTLDAFDHWRAAALLRLGALKGSGDRQAVADAITAVTNEHPTFARLTALLSTVFERNVSTEAVTRFKLALHSSAGELVPALNEALPSLSQAQSLELLQMTWMQISALWPPSHPTAAVQAALEHPELAGTAIDFESSLSRTIVVFVHGLEALGAQEETKGD